MPARVWPLKVSITLVAPALFTLTTVTASASGQHLSLSASSARPNDHLRITVTGYKPNVTQPVFMACKSQRNPIYGSWIWRGKSDAHGTLSVQEVVPTPVNPFTRPYTSCRVYAVNSSGVFALSVPFRILSPKK